jgi:hypothetical protein
MKLFEIAPGQQQSVLNQILGDGSVEGQSPGYSKQAPRMRHGYLLKFGLPYSHGFAHPGPRQLGGSFPSPVRVTVMKGFARPKANYRVDRRC